jgi:hypothetical protein
MILETVSIVWSIIFENNLEFLNFVSNELETVSWPLLRPHEKARPGRTGLLKGAGERV